MSNQNKYDDLDNFFRKYLNQSSSSEEDWAVPPDEVWERALPHFKEEKKKKGLVFWLAIGCGILAIGLVTMGIVLFQMNHKINHLEHEQAIIKTQQADATLKKNAKVSDVFSENTSKKAVVGNASNRKKELTIDGKSELNNKKSSLVRTLQSQDLTLSGNTAGNFRVETKEGSLEYLVSKSISLLNLDTRAKLESLVIQTGVQSLDFKEVKNKNALVFDKKLPTAPKYLSTKKSFASTLGFELMYFVPILMNLSNNNVQEPILKDYNNWAWSKGFGLNLVYQFDDKWSITSGITRTSLNKQFLAYGVERYNELNNRAFDDGRIENQVILDMFSPIGNRDEAVTIQTTRKRLVPHNTPIILDGCIMHNLEMVRIPVGVRLNALKYNHLRLTAEFGIGYNIVTSNNYEVSYAILMNDERIIEKDYRIELETPMNNDIWDAAFTLGLQQRIGNHWNWNWNVSYTQSLHKIPNDITADEENYWKGMRFQMGLGYTLE
ncbi:MAG: hypothetical protein ACPG19_12770 [Saprospiraceae bacterium]